MSCVPAISGTKPHLVSMMPNRVPGATYRKSAPRASWKPPPKAAPWTAAITDTGSSRQIQTMCWAKLAMPCVRWLRSANGRILLPSAAAVILSTSSPAHNARPSPDITTARTPGSARRRAPVSAMALNMAGSSAFILSARLSRTSAMPSVIVRRTRSCMTPSFQSLAEPVGARPQSFAPRPNRKSRQSSAPRPAHAPSAASFALEDAWPQAKRLRSDTRNPELHPLDGDFDESGVRPVGLLQEIGLVCRFPESLDRQWVFDQYRPAGEGSEGLFMITLENKLDAVGAANVGRLLRTPICNEEYLPISLFAGRQHASHRPCIDAAGLGTGYQPAVPNAFDQR